MIKKKKRWGLIAAAVVVAAVSVLLYMNSSPADRQQTALPDAAGIQFEAVREHVSNSIEVKGKTSYVKETWVHAPFTAEVAQWNVKEGQPVEQGDVLFRLDGSKLQNEIDVAQAGLLQRQLQVRLSEAQAAGESPSGGLTDGKELLTYHANQETARLQRELNRLELRIAETNVQDQEARLRLAEYASPESGIFLFGDNGETQLVQKDERVGKIVDLSQLQLISTVSEYEVFRIKEGMAVDVKIDALKDVKLQGRVEQVSKFARAGSGQHAGAAQFELVISLDSSDNLIAGLSLTGKIITDSKENALVVPTIAVMREDERHYVWLSTGGQEAEKRYIRIGLETADKTEVLEGLAEGDTILLR